jgi:hypothetical protein
MLQGKPLQTTEAETMRAIRGILSGTDPAVAPSGAKRSVAPRPVETAPDLTLTPVREVDAKVTLPKFTTIPGGEAPVSQPEIIRTGESAHVPERAAPAPKRASRPGARPTAALTASLPAGLLRAAPRWGAIAVLFGCAMLYPALVVAPVFLTLFLVIGAFVLFGGGRVWFAVSAVLDWYARRRPARAQRLLARLDAFAVRWDAILDRFPEGSVDGLYMPDLSTMSGRDDREDAALAARLARMHSQV